MLYMGSKPQERIMKPLSAFNIQHVLKHTLGQMTHVKLTHMLHLLSYLYLLSSHTTWALNTTDNYVNKSRACNILIGFDEELFKQYDENMTVITDIAQNHVDKVNEIYNKGVFVDDYSDIYFRLARVQVMFGACDSFRYENCTENKKKFLEIFDQYDFSNFCLGFMFAYRDFDEGIAGLASIGTACWKKQNSGFVTFLNYQRERDFNETAMTFAHELGHSFGALHDDEEHEEDDECNDNYIMSSTANDTVKEEFSNCTVELIHAKLRSLLESTDMNCLLPVDPETAPLEIALCGNNIVEPGEECDCGHDSIECNDPCCYPAIISSSERSANDSAMPCTRNARARCVTPGGLLYGIYLPFGVIIILIVLTTVLLRNDWIREKAFFKHVTHGNIRIVTKRSRRGNRVGIVDDDGEDPFG